MACIPNIRLVLDRLSPPGITAEHLRYITEQFSRQHGESFAGNYLVLLARIAADMPEHSESTLLLAGRLLIHHVRSAVDAYFGLNTLYNRICCLTKCGAYDAGILGKYSKHEIDHIERGIYLPERDYDLPYASARVFCDKYLLKGADGAILETPQQANILVCMCMFIDECDKARRMQCIARMYGYLSGFVVNLPTPIYCGLRTPLKSYSSCCILDIGDDPDSIASAAYMAAKAVTHRYGIGFNCCRLSGDIVPVLKLLEASTKTFTQGVRGGSATCAFPFWHIDIQLVVQLKNNRGVSENRVRNMDYSIGLNRLFLERAIHDRQIALFAPRDVPRLTNYFKYTDASFRHVYESYEADASIRRKTVSALELLKQIARERYETGRVYVYFIDNANIYSAFAQSVFAPNLCQEIFLPTQPSYIYPGAQGLAGVCILASVNLGRLSDVDCFTDMRDIAHMLVRGLNNIIDTQQYAFPQLEKMAKAYRPLGIGISDLFHLLARKRLKHNTRECRDYVHALMEHWRYYLLEASCQLAQEHGACSAFELSTYSHGIMPLFKDSLLALCDSEYTMDWQRLAEKVAKHGLRNACLSAVPPTSSSSAVSNSTPGIDPPRSLLTTKLSKSGTVYQLVPGYSELAGHYETASDIDNVEYLKLVGIIQKFVDQGVSTSTYYLSGKAPALDDVFREITTAFSYGLKSLYYLNASKGTDADDSADNCTSGACSI